jgi:hypothetical protein
MSIISKIFSIGTALRAGEELSKSETWKNRQVAINSILSLIGVIVLFVPEELQISGEAAESIAGGIVTVGGLVNAYLTTATSKKVGVKKHK